MLATLFLIQLALVVCEEGFRLPRTVFPTQYTLKIVTDLDSNGNFTFEGEVWIEVRCVKSTDTIILHAGEDMKINENEIEVHQDRNTHNLFESLERVPNIQILALQLSQELHKGKKYIINIQFSGEIKEEFDGYYRSSYVDKVTHETKWISTTHFEPSNARRAFPCFDEPEFKSRFKISLGHHEKYSGISNMPLNYTEPILGKNDWTWDHFENSVRMSTYLVAFVVSDFEYVIAPQNYSDVTFRVWTRPDAKSQAKYASEIGPRLLNYYEKYFGIPFPLPKQDMIAIPDFSHGAMENWGTNHLQVHPEWNTLDVAVFDTMDLVYKLDSLLSSHPVSVNVTAIDEIVQIFDAISYSKGCFLLRMMNLFMGEQTFRQGLKNYLNEYIYSNADQDDLWQALTKEAHQRNVLPHRLTIKKIMDTWTLQTGYPVITVTRNYERGTAKITQQRYLSSVSNETNTGKPCWILPLTYTVQGKEDFANTKPDLWMDCNRNQVVIGGLPNYKHWIIFNIQITGLFRVNYDERNWKLIENTLNSDKFTTISTLNRAQLIEDAFGLAMTGYLEYDVVFRLVNYLQRDTEYLPWSAALKNLAEIYAMIDNFKIIDIFDDYLKGLLSSRFSEVEKVVQDVQTDDVQKIYLQRIVMKSACLLEIGDCVDYSRVMFNKWMSVTDPDEDNPITPDLRDIVYCNAIKKGGKTEWNFVWGRYSDTNIATDKPLMLKALTCSEDPTILKRYLERTLDESGEIRKQDSWNVFGLIADNKYGFQVAKDFLYNNINRLFHFFDKRSTNLLGKYIERIVPRMVTEHDLNEFQTFLADNEEKFNMSTMAKQQALEMVVNNVHWIEHRLPSFTEALKTVS